MKELVKPVVWIVADRSYVNFKFWVTTFRPSFGLAWITNDNPANRRRELSDAPTSNGVSYNLGEA